MSASYIVALPNGFQGWLAASDKLDTIWKPVARMLERAREHNRGEFELEDVLFALRNNTMHLWCVSKEDEVYAVLVTELVFYARFPSLRIVLLAGKDHDKWQDLWPGLEHFARLYGCKHIEALTRPGVGRMFEKVTGMKEVYRMLSVPVSEGVLQ